MSFPLPDHLNMVAISHPKYCPRPRIFPMGDLPFQAIHALNMQSAVQSYARDNEQANITLLALHDLLTYDTFAPDDSFACLRRAGWAVHAHQYTRQEWPGIFSTDPEGDPELCSP